MDHNTVENIKIKFASKNIKMTPGLDESELHSIESTYGFSFPPDLRFFFQRVLPQTPNFPDWRDTSPKNIAKIRQKMHQPVDDLIVDVTENGFWIDEWGPCPKDRDLAVDYVKKLANSAPKLIPLFFHRYMPSEPNAAGNPVYSMHHNDIISYGSNLDEYLQVEMKELFQNDIKDRPHRHVPFWGDLRS